MTTNAYERDDLGAGQRAAYNTEHWLAWLLAAAALVMGVIGLLAGFGIIGEDDAAEGAAQAIAADLANWQEGMLWLVAAISVGLVSVALHNTQHHTQSSMVAATEGRGLFNTEHALAYLLGLATIAAATLSLLVGFDVFDNDNTFADGMLWGFAGLVTGVLTVTLHAVGHHRQATDEAVIVRIIEERTGVATPRTTAERMPGRETTP